MAHGGKHGGEEVEEAVQGKDVEEADGGEDVEEAAREWKLEPKVTACLGGGIGQVIECLSICLATCQLV